MTALRRAVTALPPTSRRRAPRLLPRRPRQALLTAHVIMSVGLLGDSAGFRRSQYGAATTDNPAVVIELVKVLNMFSLVFGIPLSFGALLSGLALGLGNKPGARSDIRGSQRSCS